jgi:hypothetical protein
MPATVFHCGYRAGVLISFHLADESIRRLPEFHWVFSRHVWRGERV